MRSSRHLFQDLSLAAFLAFCLGCLSCSANNDNAHTTATTFVSPPPHQILRVTPHSREAVRVVSSSPDPNLHGDPAKPLLFFNLANGQTYHEGEEVLIEFSLSNAKLKGDGGEYRVRYIIDDDEPQWIDKWEPLGFSGWIPGKHTIRLELIGPDGWPYRNGDYNVVTREIQISPN